MMPAPLRATPEPSSVHQAHEGEMGCQINTDPTWGKRNHSDQDIGNIQSSYQTLFSSQINLGDAMPNALRSEPNPENSTSRVRSVQPGQTIQSAVGPTEARGTPDSIFRAQKHRRAPDCSQPKSTLPAPASLSHWMRLLKFKEKNYQLHLGDPYQCLLPLCGTWICPATLGTKDTSLGGTAAVQSQLAQSLLSLPRAPATAQTCSYSLCHWASCLLPRSEESMFSPWQPRVTSVPREIVPHLHASLGHWAKQAPLPSHPIWPSLCSLHIYCQPYLNSRRAQAWQCQQETEHDAAPSMPELEQTGSRPLSLWARHPLDTGVLST